MSPVAAAAVGRFGTVDVVVNNAGIEGPMRLVDESSRYFSSGTLQIRYGTSSNVDASDIDQLVITGTHN